MCVCVGPHCHYVRLQPLRFSPRAVNYQKNWKCAAVLKPDGTPHFERDTPSRGGADKALSTSATVASAAAAAAVAAYGSGNGGSSGGGGGHTGGAGGNSTTKYYKRGIISHPNQVPWH